MKKTLLSIFTAILICFAVGLLAGLAQNESIQTWYPLLDKPSLTPPNAAFPIAWSILYICMGISIGLIAGSSHPRRKEFIALFGYQLFLNFMWSILFFYMKSPLVGMIDIVLLEILLIVYAVKTYKDFKVSSILFIPYIAWVGFACYLNFYILMNN